MFILKIKFFTMLSMVCVGLFSRFMLGFPLMIPLSGTIFQRIPQTYHFPDGGNRTSLRLVSMNCGNSRRRKLKRGPLEEEEISMPMEHRNSSFLDFIGEVINERT